ncbi:MAG TPA: hypothetical protein VFU22_02680 [Roseiflexaceae bacterium]|nr:hypothetical protein [Roseiflexaceae bacterium]
MRRSLFGLGVGLALLLFSTTLVFVGREAQHSQAPPGATGVRVFRRGLSEMNLSYRMPKAWSLNHLYQHYSARGWERDRLTERSLQRPWTDAPTMVFAIFTRQRLFGLISEIAIVGMPADSRTGVLVRQVRCLKIEPWVGCL